MKTNESPTETTYNSLAPVYDDLTSQDDYELLGALLLRLLIEHGLSDRAHIYDVAAGTGKVARFLARRGHELTLSDLSGAMLAKASERPELANASVFRADMLSLPFTQEFDAVTCIDDAVNYILEPTHLRAAFRGIRRNLRPDGLLIFDANTARTFSTAFCSTAVQEGSDFLAIWKGEGADSMASGPQYNMTTTVFRKAESHWTRYDGTHHERYYSPGEIVSSLTACGFSSVATYGLCSNGSIEPADELKHHKIIYVAHAARPARHEGGD